MKDFVRSAGRLRALPLPARLTYSIFLAFTLVALGFTGWLGADMLGANLHGIDEYYAGAAQPEPPAAPMAADSGNAPGPRLELPSDAFPPAAPDPIPLRKLLEVTHFHLFSLPVYLMILSHLFMLSSLGTRTKTLWIVTGSAGVALHIAAPWVARSGGAAARLFYAGSGLLLTAAFLVMSGVPLLEMWRPRSAARP
jgi:hypothetical protein